jgi:hypothetical protein
MNTVLYPGQTVLREIVSGIRQVFMVQTKYTGNAMESKGQSVDCNSNE